MILNFGTSTSKYGQDYKKTDLSEGAIAFILSCCIVGVFVLAYYILKWIYLLIKSIFVTAKPKKQRPI